MPNNTYVAIMAGGIGSRFWPSSRTSLPKQFLDILGTGKSLIRLTFERFLKLCPAENIFIVTNKAYRELVKEHLPELQESQILCEPSRNNTAPCVAYAGLKIKSLNPDANLIVAPSDHIILDENNFVETLKKGLAFTAAHNALLTLGILPTRPDTGYGYINFEKENQNGIHSVIRFTEKPPLEKAKAFVESGDYLWNAGIFIWSVNSLISAFETHSKEIVDILGKDTSKYNTAEEQAYIDENYPLTPSISIDYAIMEKADNVYTIPSSFGWSDLGTWASLYSELEKDAKNNVLQGNIIDQEVNDCMVKIKGDKLAVIRGLKDFIVIDEEDILLIYPKGNEQEIKKVHAIVKEKTGQKHI